MHTHTYARIRKQEGKTLVHNGNVDQAFDKAETIVESQYYLAPIGAASLLFAAAFTELPLAYQRGAWGIVTAHPLTFLASALLGLAASFMTFLVIKVTNSVTLKVLNTARNAGFVLFTVTFLGEPATALQLAGYAISLTAFSVYTYYKLQEK